jgi:gamma-glutamyltranspeptidase/glutathione hydrolase
MIWVNNMSVEIKRRSTGKKAIVSSGKEQATAIGIDILEKGGNAIDAAVAVGFAIGVAEPATSGLGGGGFMTIKSAYIEDAVFLDFREFAPENATPEMWELDEKGKVVNKENAIGAKSVSVPGELAGMVYALEKYGTMTLEEVIEPSIRLAEEGVLVTDMTVNMIETYSKYLKKCPDAKKIYLNDGKGFKEGDFLKNEDLGKTLKKISNEGLDIFYEGEIAEAIIETVQKNGGVLTRSDLKDYYVELKEPVKGTYRGYTIISSPPPSSGGTHIIETLNILENFDMGSLDVNSAEYLHLMAEAFKLSYEDRAKYMADTNFVDVPLKGLRSKEYAKKLAEKIDLEQAKNSSSYDPWTYEHDETTHYSIGDDKGNLVSVTKTVNHFFGSCMVAEGTGILLNDTMADFATRKYDVNSVDRRKKPLSTMSPTMILKDGKPFAVLGSPGGARIINAVVQVISKLIDYDMDIQDAISSPRIHQNTSDILYCEDRIDVKELEKLEKMGHEIFKRLPYDKKMGGVQGIKYEKREIVGGADPRRDGISKGI